MEGKLQQPQDIWDLFAMRSISEIGVFLDGQKFEYKQQLDNGLLYSSFGEALIVEIENNIPKLITYKTNREPDYTLCIGYAMESLKYKIVDDERNANEHLLRLDGDKLALFCRCTIPQESVDYSLRLMSKASLINDRVGVNIFPL